MPQLRLRRQRMMLLLVLGTLLSLDYKLFAEIEAC